MAVGKGKREMAVLKWIDQHFEEAILAILLVIMSLLTGAQVFMRYVLNNSLTWSEELNRFCYIWSGFISVGYCIRKRIEIRIDMIVNALPHTLHEIVDIIATVITIILLALFLKGGCAILNEVLVSGQTSSSLNLPMKYVYAAPVVGFGIGILRSLQHIFLIFVESANCRQKEV